MNALKGAASVILIQLAYWLIPPDHDPVFMQLPLQHQVFFLAVLLAMILGGVILFINGCLDAPKKGGA